MVLAGSLSSVLWAKGTRMDPKPRKEVTLSPLVRTFDAHRDATECITHLFFFFNTLCNNIASGF